MSDKLGGSTQARARELARQITVANDLDPEIQEELYGHIEDKLLAYKSGEEAVTEDGALTLVREHFGDTQTLRGLLQDVHVEAVHVGLARKVLVLVIATMALRITTMSIHNLLTLLSAPFIESAEQFGGLFSIPVSTGIVAVIGLATFVWLLRNWRRMEREGTSPWYNQWRIRTLLISAVTLLSINWVYPWVFPTWGFTAPGPGQAWAMSALFWASAVGLYAVWYWWSEADKRSLVQGLVVAAIWVLFQFALSLAPGQFLIALGRDPVPGQFELLGMWKLGSLNFAVYGSFWGFSALGGIQRLLEYGVVTGVCTLALWGVCRARRWRTGRSEHPTSAT